MAPAATDAPPTPRVEPTAPPPSETDRTPDPTPVATPEPTPDATERPDPTGGLPPDPTPRPTRTPDEGPRVTERPARTAEPEPPATERPVEPESSDGGAAASLVMVSLAAAVPSSASPVAGSPVPGLDSPGILDPIRAAVALLIEALMTIAAALPFDLAADTEPGSSPQPGATSDPGTGTRLPWAPPTYGRSHDDVVPGIDLSLWNDDVPFRALRRVGVRFAFIKATQGTSIVDPALRDHLAGARAAGYAVGAYHFYDYRLGGRAQGDHFVDAVVDADFPRRALPMVVDVECFPPFGAADRAFVRRELRAFVGRVYERTGRLPMVYTSWYMWRQVTGSDPSFGRLPLWVACWRCARPALPVGWDDWDVWQIGSIVIDDRGRRVGADIADEGLVR